MVLSPSVPGQCEFLTQDAGSEHPFVQANRAFPIDKSIDTSGLRVTSKIAAVGLRAAAADDGWDEVRSSDAGRYQHGDLFGDLWTGDGGRA